MSTTAAEDVIAAELVAARREGRSLTRFPGALPASMAEAYQIQELAMLRWQDSLVGWKIGYIPADRRTARDPDRLVGPIWRQQYHLSEEHVSAVEVGIFASGFAAVEAELVIRLGQDLPADVRGGWTADEAAGLEQHLLLGIEVASSPIADINSLGPTVIAADFGNNNGLVLGSILADRPGGGPVQLACYIDGHLMGEGSAENLPGGIHHGLATALNILASRGQPVRAGMVFATGAITGIHPIGPGQFCRVDVRGGPSVELRTADGRTLVRT
ncbi:MAG: 2-keto-4-pentenoate hydratase [Propionibacteriaceae bacterium]